MKRFSVLAQGKEFITYASDDIHACAKVADYLNVLPGEIGLSKELPPLEEESHGPVIDVAPAREVRK